MQTLHLVVKITPRGQTTRVDLQVFGDLKPAGVPPYDPTRPQGTGNVESGPSYSTAFTVDGTPLQSGVDQGTVDEIGMRIREVLIERTKIMMAHHMEGRMVPVPERAGWKP